MQVGLGPGDIVLHAHPVLPKPEQQRSLIGTCYGVHHDHIVLDATLLLRKGHSSPHTFRPIFVVAKVSSNS